MGSRLFILIMGVVLLSPVPVWAHALGAEARFDPADGKVHVEAYFDDDSPAVNAKVEVQDGQEKTVAAGKTDARGFWSFPAPAAGRYVVLVDAGAGHRARKPIEVPAATTSPKSLTFTAPEKTIISDGPTREDFTRFPYLKVGLGVGGIFLFSLAFLVARRKSSGR
jgi:hypothetical protein